jgi:hypothetical protein
MMRENGDLMVQSAALPGNVDLYLHVRVLVAIIPGLSVTFAFGAVLYEISFLARNYGTLN